MTKREKKRQSPKRSGRARTPETGAKAPSKASSVRFLRSTTCLCAGLLFIAFAVFLWGTLTSFGGRDTEKIYLPAGAVRQKSFSKPQSGEDIRRMFAAMSRTYRQEDAFVFEPITKDYLSLVEKRRREGKILPLSVEEILFILSDAETIYGKYDIIRLFPEQLLKQDMTVIAENSRQAPADHVGYLRICDIYKLILYRITSLGDTSAYEIQSNGDLVYHPYGADGYFIFSLPDTERLTGAVCYVDAGSLRTAVFPSESLARKARMTGVESRKDALSETEKSLSEAGQYDSAHLRFLTPSYWIAQKRTDCCLFAYGRQVMVADPHRGQTIDLLARDEQLLSLAVGDRNADGMTEIYYTHTVPSGGSALGCYNPVTGLCQTLRTFPEPKIGVFEKADGTIAVYATESLTNSDYVVAMVRIGEALYIR